jgi:hypothetical protein
MLMPLVTAITSGVVLYCQHTSELKSLVKRKRLKRRIKNEKQQRFEY